MIAVFLDYVCTVCREAQKFPVHLQPDVINFLSQVSWHIAAPYARGQHHDRNVCKVGPQVIYPFRKHEIGVMAGRAVSLPLFRGKCRLNSGPWLTAGGIHHDHAHALLWILCRELVDYDSAERVAHQDVGWLDASCRKRSAQILSNGLDSTVRRR